jgi:hypothetical protein
VSEVVEIYTSWICGATWTIAISSLASGALRTHDPSAVAALPGGRRRKGQGAHVAAPAGRRCHGRAPSGASTISGPVRSSAMSIAHVARPDMISTSRRAALKGRSCASSAATRCLSGSWSRFRPGDNFPDAGCPCPDYKHALDQPTGRAACFRPNAVATGALRFTFEDMRCAEVRFAVSNDRRTRPEDHQTAILGGLGCGL